MKTLNLVQGTQEWLDDRLTKFTASEAPAAMGDCKHFSRNQLLDHKKGWTSIVNDYVLKLFQSGHDAEESARPIAERILDEDLAPLCGQLEGSLYMASFDGITMFGDILFEHKLWNKTLAENVMNNLLEPHYYWQLEHQLLVSGAEKVLFMVSDGTEQNMAYMFYEPVDGRREQLISGWQQFAKDLASHELKAKTVPVVAEVVQDLPSISYKMNGLALISNLDEYKAKALELVEKSKKPLETDQDFANAESMVKVFKESEGKISIMAEQVLGEVSSIDTFVKDLKFIGEQIRQARLATEKQVKTRKDEIRTELVTNAKREFAELVFESSKKLGVNIQVTADFASAIKGKRNIESMQSAINDTMAAAKTELTTREALVQSNLSHLKEFSEYKFLFNDWSSIAEKPHDDFVVLVKSRIAEHKEAEAKRLEAERERIRQEEEAKAKREAEAKLKAEQEAKAAEEKPKLGDNLQAQQLSKSAIQQPQDQAATLRTQVRLQQAQAIVDEVQSAPVSELKCKPAETITITLSEYNDLLACAEKLEALEAAGVDNWTGYGEAMEMLKAS